MIHLSGEGLRAVRALRGSTRPGSGFVLISSSSYHPHPHHSHHIHHPHPQQVSVLLWVIYICHPQAAFVRLGLRTDSGLVIFSRLPVAETRSIRFESGAALDAGACKGAMWARRGCAKGHVSRLLCLHLWAN